MTFARSSIIARTSRSGSRSPTPAAWLRTRLTCSSARRSGGIATSDSLPNPVVTPYATACRLDDVVNDASRYGDTLPSMWCEGNDGSVAGDGSNLLECERISVDDDFIGHSRECQRGTPTIQGSAPRLKSVIVKERSDEEDR